MNNKFDWDKYKHLGHEFVLLKKNMNNATNGWFKCVICDVKVYIDNNYSPFRDVLKYWGDNLFHDNEKFRANVGVVDFNLTCDEVLIKKIIE